MNAEMPLGEVRSTVYQSMKPRADRTSHSDCLAADVGVITLREYTYTFVLCNEFDRVEERSTRTDNRRGDPNFTRPTSDNHRTRLGAPRSSKEGSSLSPHRAMLLSSAAPPLVASLFMPTAMLALDSSNFARQPLPVAGRRVRASRPSAGHSVRVR